MKVLNYNTRQFYLKDLIKKSLNTKTLSFIHKNSDFVYHTKFERKNDQSTHYHKMFYDFSRTHEFQDIYKSFVEEVIKPEFNEEVVYQTIPTFRLHFPGNIAVGEYHRDRNYRDEAWARRVKEINFFLPFTDSFGTNTIWVESEEDKKDFYPIEIEYGQLVMWDGSNLLHGNKTNEERTTRVSFDFRVIPISRYEPSDYGSINTKTKFELGGYYSKI